MTKTLIPAQRRQQIKDYLAQQPIVQIAALSEILQVSEATVRRDLEWLEDQGVVERAHGGAILSQRMQLEPDYAHSVQAFPDEKRRIGAAAAALVEEDDTLFVNSGSTTTQFVSHLRGFNHLTVVTNNISAALEAGEAGFEILLLGGSFRSRAKSVVGRFAADALRQVYASKTFIGVDGISLKYGCTTPISAEAEIAQLMIARTRGPVIVVADHSKLGVVSNFEIAPIGQIHSLVTDDGFDAAAREELAARAVEVVIASSESVGRTASLAGGRNAGLPQPI